MSGKGIAIALAALAVLCSAQAEAQKCEITCRSFNGGASTKSYCTVDPTPSRCSTHAEHIALREHASCQALWRDHCRFSADPYRHSVPDPR